MFLIVNACRLRDLSQAELSFPAVRFLELMQGKLALICHVSRNLQPCELAANHLSGREKNCTQMASGIFLKNLPGDDLVFHEYRTKSLAHDDLTAPLLEPARYRSAFDKQCCGLCRKVRRSGLEENELEYVRRAGDSESVHRRVALQLQSFSVWAAT